MGYGDADDQDSVFRRPLAPEDRLWRHPAEVAAAARLAAAQRARRRRIRVLSSLVVGGIATAAVITQARWGVPSAVPATQQALTAAVGPTTQSTTTLLSYDLWASDVVAGTRASTAVVQSATGTTALAGAVSVGDDGYLITSGRALGEETEFLVHGADGSIAEATLIGYDAATDLSVLKTDLAVQTAPLASERAADGDSVAILNPSGEALHRVVISQASSTEAIDGDTLVGLISLDSSLNDLPPGSPIIDTNGSVIGIATATAPGAAMAIIPIDIARAVALALIEYGQVDYARLGVTAKNPDDHVLGARISKVGEGGPAEQGGIEAGDLLIQIEQDQVVSVASMVAVLRRHEPGDIVDVLVEREGETVSCLVELGESDVLSAHTDDEDADDEDTDDGDADSDTNRDGEQKSDHERSNPDSVRGDELAELRELLLR